MPAGGDWRQRPGRASQRDRRSAQHRSAVGPRRTTTLSSTTGDHSFIDSKWRGKYAIEFRVGINTLIGNESLATVVCYSSTNGNRFQHSRRPTRRPFVLRGRSDTVWYNVLLAKKASSAPPFRTARHVFVHPLFDKGVVFQ